MGIMMALTRVNPVVSHWAVDASTDISTMTDGRAGVTTVWLRTATNVPTMSTTSIAICLLVSFKANLSSCRAVLCLPGPRIRPRPVPTGF